MQETIRDQDLQRVIALYLSIPRRTLAGGKRILTLWAANPEIVAKIVVIILKSKVHPYAWQRATEAVGTKIGQSTLRKVTMGLKPSGDVWPALRELLIVARVPWNGMNLSSPADVGIISAPMSNNAGWSGSPSWRVVGDDIHVVESRVLKYGTPEHAAKMREIMLDLGKPRTVAPATSVTTQ